MSHKVDLRGRRIPDNELDTVADSAVTIDTETGVKSSKRVNKLASSSDLGGTLNPSEIEQQLLGLIGEQGVAELKKLFSGNAFQLDAATKEQLNTLKASQLQGAQSALTFGLNQAIGAATSGAAARGLPQGSLFTELAARFGNPAVQQFQQSVAGINAQDAQRRITQGRQDFALRQAALESPALTALQRSRLASAELRLRLRGLNIQNRSLQNQENSAFGSFLGNAVGTAVGFAADKFGGGNGKPVV